MFVFKKKKYSTLFKSASISYIIKYNNKKKRYIYRRRLFVELNLYIESIINFLYKRKNK